jgi:hypothetical protein
VWRELFVLISFLSLCIFILRVLSFKKLKFEKKEVSSLQTRSKTKKYWPKIAQAAILVGIVNSIFYFVNNYINTHSMIENLTIDTSKFLVNMIATFCFALFLFFWGKVLINKNYKFSFLMKVGMTGTSFFLFLSFLFSESSMIKILFSQIGLVFFAQLMTVTVLNEILYMFPKEMKTESLGISLSLGNSIIGGAVPLTSSLFLSNNLNSFMPLIYLFLLIVIGMYCVKLIDEERKKGSDERVSSV